MGSILYNEKDEYAAAWLKNLVAADLIAPGEVTTCCVSELDPEYVSRFTQVHLFAGIGGWSHALRLTGWADDEPVWTASAPCQPFSAAGKQKGMKDERHLWPVVQNLITECRPPIIFGEQVERAIAHGWADEVFDGVEKQGYSVGSSVLPATSANGSHVGPRIYFVCALPPDRVGAPRSRTSLPIGGARPQWPCGPEDLQALIRAPKQPGERHPQPVVCLNHDGIPAKLDKARTLGAGNAIFPPLAANFIAACDEALQLG